MGKGVLYNFVFTVLPFETVSGEVSAFHSIFVCDLCNKESYLFHRLRPYLSEIFSLDLYTGVFMYFLGKFDSGNQFL